MAMFSLKIMWRWRPHLQDTLKFHHHLKHSCAISTLVGKTNMDAVIVELGPGILRKTKEYPIAIGHIADVYQGEVRLGPARVLKVALKDLRGVPCDDAARNALQEPLKKSAPIWRSLKHPNVVPFLGLAYHIGHVATLVSPLYENGNVLDFLKVNPTADKVKLIEDVSAGLLYLHSLPPPLVHADLKGSNILVRSDGTACLTDFGLLQITNTVEFTSSSLAGPCRYQAPEVLDFEGFDSPFTTRSDVYAFAMLSLEIVTGQKPFHHRRQDTPVILDVIMGKRPPKPENNASADIVWPLLQDCWSQNPEKRPEMVEVHHRVQSLRH